MTSEALPLSRSDTPARPRGRTPALRLRARRRRGSEIHRRGLHAVFQHPMLGGVRAAVQDLSMHGLGLVLPGAAGSAHLVWAGDRLETLDIYAGNEVVYRGHAIVRRANPEDEALVVGVELMGGGLDLAEIYGRGSREGFAARWAEAEREAARDAVRPELRHAVSDLRLYLDGVARFLDAESGSHAREDALTRSELEGQCVQTVLASLTARLDGAMAEVGAVVDAMTDAERRVHRSFFQSELMPFLVQSPLLRRCFEKPLGYAGDYEMMNMIYEGRAEGHTLFGRALNVYAATTAASTAVVNRRQYLADHMRAAILRSSAPRVRVASIGSGPAREVVTLLEAHPELGRRLELLLVDQDARALAFCERTLAPLALATGARIHFVEHSVRRLLATPDATEVLGAVDLIYSAGLFDYFQDRAFAALLSTLYGALAPGGRLVLGNFAARHPSRWVMEFLCDWFLNLRGPDELLALTRALYPAPAQVEVDREPAGVNLFLLIDR